MARTGIVLGALGILMAMVLALVSYPLLSGSISSSESNSEVEVVPLLVSHLVKMDGRNSAEVLADYTSDASVVWTGTTQGYGGSFNGTTNIQFLLKTFLGDATAIDFVLLDANVTSQSSSVATISADISFSGDSRLFGAFNGTVSASYDYVDQGGQWLISKESWNFSSFNVQLSLGASPYF